MKKSKRFEFDIITENKLQEILEKKTKKAKYAGVRNPTQTDIVKESIDLHYSHVFSDNYNDLVLEKLERMLGNRVQKVMQEYFEVLATIVSSDKNNIEMIKQLSMLMVRATAIDAFSDQLVLNEKVAENERVQAKLLRAIESKIE